MTDTHPDAGDPRITRDEPGCVLFLLDQSASMLEPFLGSTRSKADALAHAVNRAIYNLILQSMPYGEVWDYFHIGAIGYGGHGVEYAFGGDLEGLDRVRLSQLAASNLGERDRGDDDPEPFWIVPKASGMTPMCEALDHATEIVAQQCQDFPNSIPPIVINVTDGQASDGHPRTSASRLQQTGTSLGNTMLFNLQLSVGDHDAVLYPASSKVLGDAYARLLFAASSPLPAYMIKKGRAIGLTIPDGARGFAHNADMTTLTRFLAIGTKPGNMV